MSSHVILKGNLTFLVGGKLEGNCSSTLEMWGKTS